MGHSPTNAPDSETHRHPLRWSAEDVAPAPPDHQPGRKMQMPFDRNACKRNACLAAAVLAPSVMPSAFADARPIHDRPAGYLFPCAALDRVGDGPFQYRGNSA